MCLLVLSMLAAAPQGARGADKIYTCSKDTMRMETLAGYFCSTTPGGTTEWKFPSMNLMGVDGICVGRRTSCPCMPKWDYATTQLGVKGQEPEIIEERKDSGHAVFQCNWRLYRCAGPPFAFRQ